MTQKDFNNCAKNGGKVKIKDLKNNKYIKICYDKVGKSHSSRVMKKEIDKNKQVEDNKDSKVLEESLLKLREYYNENRI